MDNIRCPKCGKFNPSNLETCQFCGTRLKPLPASTPVDSKPIKAGEGPTVRDTSEFEKVKPARGAPIHAGEAPTKKDTSELEQALPSWLRSLRSGEEPTGGEFEPEAGANDEPDSLSKGPAFDSSTPPDRLSGLERIISQEDEEIPDWLAQLGGSKPAETAQKPAEQETPIEPDSSDWLARLGGDSQAVTPVAQTPGQAAEEPLPDWIQSMQIPEAGALEAPATPGAGEGFPDWLSGLPGISDENAPASQATEESAEASQEPDWLKRLEQETPVTEPASPAESPLPTPEWLSGSTPEAETPVSSDGEGVPAWLSNLEAASGGDVEAPSAPPAIESQAAEPAPTADGEMPDWLSKIQADAVSADETEKHKDDFEVVPGAPAIKEESEATPAWLTGLEGTKPPSGATPALILEEADKPSGDEAFSMETPDWLSKIKPEQEGGDRPVEQQEERSASENIPTSELPSWVQAMRPVESVISEAAPEKGESAHITEQSGPLAGLSGVLPSAPGLGQLRKPPAYSVKLQMSEGQQRYAAFLERMVADETKSSTVESTHLKSNRVWRWVISGLFLLVIGLVLFTSVQLTPGTALKSSDKGSAGKIVEGIQESAPVLIAFDYDPALSGELEAAAAPLVDQLLDKKVRLTLISTSLTGPALAEHFLDYTPLVDYHQYQSGAQYINLGYLAGGPAGILYFATDPQNAAPKTIDGAAAWDMVPLQGVQALSDFSAVIVLTDNGDTGRSWIEQAGSRLGHTPLVMVVSAQAAPMVRPYYDSGQLQGLVAGLADAKVYEQDFNRPGLAHRYWSAYSVGSLLAVILITIGAIQGLVAGLRARRTGSVEKA